MCRGGGIEAGGKRDQGVGWRELVGEEYSAMKRVCGRRIDRVGGKKDEE